MTTTQPRTRDTDPGAVEGRLRLLDAAERLFDEQGLDGPSARRIAAAAGHRNTAAVWYHFGDRGGLVEAMAQRWSLALEERRNALIDKLEADPSVTPADYVRAAVRPWVETLETAEGRRRVRLLAQMAHHPVYSKYGHLGFAPSTGRGVALAMALGLSAHLTPERLAHRAPLVISTVTSMLAAQATLIDEDPPRRPPQPTEELLDDMVNIVLAVASAP